MLKFEHRTIQSSQHIGQRRYETWLNYVQSAVRQSTLVGSSSYHTLYKRKQESCVSPSHHIPFVFLGVVQPPSLMAAPTLLFLGCLRQATGVGYAPVFGLISKQVGRHPSIEDIQLKRMDADPRLGSSLPRRTPHRGLHVDQSTLIVCSPQATSISKLIKRI